MAELVVVDKGFGRPTGKFVSQVQGMTLRGRHPALSGPDTGDLQAALDQFFHGFRGWQLVELEMGKSPVHPRTRPESRVRQDGQSVEHCDHWHSLKPSR